MPSREINLIQSTPTRWYRNRPRQKIYPAVYLYAPDSSLPIIFLGHVGDVKNMGPPFVVGPKAAIK